MKKSGLSLLLVFFLILFSTSAFAGGEYILTKGQSLYAGATYNIIESRHANIYTSTKIFIRNVDPYTSITVNSVNFYSPNGTFEHSFLEGPLELGPHESTSFLAFSDGGPSRYTDEGGRPFFLVDWEADKAVNAVAVHAMAIIVNFPKTGDAPDYDYILFGSRVIKIKK